MMKMAQITLSRKQHSLLFMDVVDVGPDPDAKEPAKSQELQLIDELKAGRKVVVTPFLLKSLVQFADKDADPDEQRCYKRLWRRVQWIDRIERR